MYIYKNRGFVVALVLLMLITSSCATAGQQTVVSKGIAEENSESINNLDNALRDLTTQIVKSMTKKEKKKVAVIEFSDLDGQVTGFGKYLSEELITRLFMSKKFEVIERQLLNQVLKEQKLSLTGLIDPASAKELGRLLGVDAIVSGTITDLGISLKVNARIISTETGEIFAVAATEIAKDATVKKLMGQVAVAQEPGERTTERKVNRAGAIFFKEDFNKYDEGDAVPSWGKELIVKKGKDGRKYLTSLIPGTHFVRQDATFSENFKFEYDWSYYDDRASGRTAPYVRVPFELIDEHGKVFRIECGNWGANLPGLNGVDFSERSMNRFKLVKKGTTFKIYNNEQFLLSGTYKGYSRFVSFRITIPVKANGKGQYFTNFTGTDLGE